MKLSCARCSKVTALELVDADGDPVEEGEVHADGLLIYVCPECMTDAEAVEQARRSAARMLDVAEDCIADYDMVADRVPALRENPEFKAAYADAQAKAAEAKATLEALNALPEQPS